MTAAERLSRAWSTNNSLLCVGLDPDPAKFPKHLQNHPQAIFEFNRAIIDATGEFVCCFKPQFAFYAAERAEDQLELTIRYIRERFPNVYIILDSKRGDIGNTAEMYAKEAFVRYGADAVTVNPYLGGDSLAPFLKDPQRAAVILCRTSNAGAKDIQDLKSGGRPLYETIAEKAAREWNERKNVLLVVGATYPQEMKAIREIAGDIPFLVPGIGAQGGDVAAVMEQGKTAHGSPGLIISASRSVLYASSGAGTSGEDFQEAAGKEAKRLRDEINQYR